MSFRSTSSSRWGAALVAIVAALSVVVLGPGVAVADDTSPVDEAVRKVQKQARAHTQGSPVPRPGEVRKGVNLDGPSQPAPEPTMGNDDDSPGHETENPEPPDHGRGHVLDVDVLEEDALDVSKNNAQVDDDDRAKADATLLALGGMEILGAHADSEGEEESHFGDPLAPICEGTEGALCLRILYADAYAKETGSRSSSSSESGLLELCVGGSSSDQREECEGNLALEVADSEGQVERNTSSGHTDASSSSDLVNFCLRAETTSEECDIALLLAHSEGQSDSRDPAATTRESQALSFALGGMELSPDDGSPFAFAIPPLCPDPSLVCIFGNQGETYAGDDVAGHSQEAFHFVLLKGIIPANDEEMTEAGDFLRIEFSKTETLVHEDTRDRAGPENPGNPGNPGGPGTPGGGPGNPGTSDGPLDTVTGVLPNTGGVWSGLIALGLFLVAAGAFAMVRGRRLAQAVTAAQAA